MSPKMLSALAMLLLALPVSAGMRQHSFQVGAVVVRSAQVHARAGAPGLPRLMLAGKAAVLVQVDSAPAQLTAAPGVPLPPGATRVTVQY